MEKKIDRTMCKTCPKIVNCVSNNLVCVKRYNELEAENETIRKFLEEVEDQVCSVTTELLNDDYCLKCKNQLTCKHYMRVAVGIGKLFPKFTHCKAFYTLSEEMFRIAAFLDTEEDNF